MIAEHPILERIGVEHRLHRYAGIDCQALEQAEADRQSALEEQVIDLGSRIARRENVVIAEREIECALDIGPAFGDLLGGYRQLVRGESGRCHGAGQNRSERTKASFGHDHPRMFPDSPSLPGHEMVRRTG